MAYRDCISIHASLIVETRRERVLDSDVAFTSFQSPQRNGKLSFSHAHQEKRRELDVDIVEIMTTNVSK